MTTKATDRRQPGQGGTPATPIAYKPADAAVALGVTRQTVYALIKRGQLRAFKVGRCTRIPIADVNALVDGETS